MSGDPLYIYIALTCRVFFSFSLPPSLLPSLPPSLPLFLPPSFPFSLSLRPLISQSQLKSLMEKLKATVNLIYSTCTCTIPSHSLIHCVSIQCTLLIIPYFEVLYSHTIIPHISILPYIIHPYPIYIYLYSHTFILPYPIPLYSHTSVLP